MKTKGKVRACFLESAKIPETVSSLERSKSCFELDESIKKFHGDLLGCRLPLTARRSVVTSLTLAFTCFSSEIPGI